jgi:hypothetical protein
MNALQVYVEGVGVWSPQLADFNALRCLIDGAEPMPPSPRPAAARLPPNERRRAPESVLLAAEVAGQAVSMSGRDADALACVFASSHGDQAITDYMCATLAHAPTELSPTRFHNSVHNAPVGYWTIATGCHASSTALAAQHNSFGAGLLEAVCQVTSDRRAVLLVCSDTASSGPLREVIDFRQSFGSALVLAPAAGLATLARLQLTLTPPLPATALDEPWAGWREANTSASALTLLTLLAGHPGRCQLDAAATLGLRIDVENVS